jgi:hypothetical protein
VTVEDTARSTFPVHAVGRAAGSHPVEWAAVETRGYARVSRHWLASLADGRTAFVKQALTPDASAWLRKERTLYEAVDGSFMPAYLGAYDDGKTTLLVLEDLSGADWPPPWSPDAVDAVLASLDELHATRPPEGIESLEADRDDVVGWGRVAADPEPLLATGLCSPAWLEHALPTLLHAGEAAELGGDELLHFDVRSDNLCLIDRRAILVDWNLACEGNGAFDVAFWLPSLRLEGGPEPSEILPDAGALAAAVAGFFAARAGLAPPPGAPTVRVFQRAQAAVALPWAAAELGLPPPSQAGPAAR